MFTNLMTRYGSFVYIYLIQSCKMPLRLQLVSIHYWLRYLRKKQMIRVGKMWDQTDGCADQYRCSITYYLMYFLSKLYQIFVDIAIDTLVYGKGVMYGFNAVQKQYLSTCLIMCSTPEVDKIDSKIIRVDAIT